MFMLPRLSELPDTIHAQYNTAGSNKTYFGFHVNSPISYVILTKSDVFSIDSISDFTKRRPVGVARTGERTNKSNPIGAYHD